MTKLFKYIRFWKNREVSLWNTLYFNFSVLPFHIAIKLPFVLGKYFQFEGIDKLNVVFSKNVHFAMVSLGLKHWPITATKGKYSLIQCYRNSTLEIGDNVIINPGFTINIYQNATLKLGSDIYINQSTSVYVKNIVQISDGTHIGWNCQLYDNTFHLIYDLEQKKMKSPLGKIFVGNYCWIANGCTLSGNVYLPTQSIVGALSLVNKDFSYVKSTGNLFVGTPATVKKTGLYRVFSHKIQKEVFHYFANNPDAVDYYNEKFDLEDLQTVDNYIKV